MTATLTKERLQELETKHPVVMTRREKLLHWAALVEKHPRPLPLFHLLERWAPNMLADPLGSGWANREMLENSAFGLAAADPEFKAAGLAGNTPAQSMKFFELTQEQLHEFSCNCGGEISNQDMANRIRNLAA